MSDALLTRTEVAKRLGVTPRTIQNLVDTGKLRETRIPSGRGVRLMPRYKTSAVKAYEDSGFVSRAKRAS